MSNVKPPETLDHKQTIGKRGAMTSIQEDDGSAQVAGAGNGQQGAGGLGGITERTTPNQAGSQPNLGGAALSPSGSKPGTGLTENGDPMSRKGVPDVAEDEEPDTSTTGPGIDA